MEGLVVLALIAAVIAGLLLSLYLKERRRKQLAFMARQLGLDFSPRDTQGCLVLPFALLQRGDGRGTENVMWGTWQAIPVRAFDYWYYEERTDARGHRSRTYHRSSCAVTEIAAACSPLRLERENLFTRIADHLALRDVEFESEEFNRTFNVTGGDRKFASDFVDARMMRWLLSADASFEFEACGRWLLCYGKRRAPLDLLPLLGTLKGFRDNVPRVVYELYPVG